jgi:hypothetical protein
MSYLENDICKFTPLFDIDYKVKKDIISMCFFKMQKGYKDFSLYLNGIQNITKYYKEKYGNTYSIRLFIDNTIYKDREIMKILKNTNGLELVLYHAPDFIREDDYHIGLFGTLIRFFPFFDFPNNDANYVFISDIGDDDQTIDNNHYILEQIKNKNFFEQLYLFKICIYENIKIETIIDLSNAKAYAPRMTFLKKFDKNIMINYLYEVKNAKKNKYSVHFHNMKSKGLENLGNFIYGVDEYLLNIVLTDYMIKNNMMFGVMTKFIIDYPIYLTYRHYKSRKINLNLKNYVLIFDYLFNKLGIDYNKNISIEKKYEIYNNIFNLIYKNPMTKSEYKLYYKANYYLYMMYIYLYDNKLYDFLYKNNDLKKNIIINFGLYYSETLYYNINNKIKKTFIKEYKLTKNDIMKLKAFQNKQNI